MILTEEEQLKILLARMSHDILSPIHTIQGLAKLISEEYDLSQRKEYGMMLLKTTRKLSQRLEELIKEYYNSSLSTEQIDFVEMTKEIIDQVQPPSDVSIEIINNCKNPFFSHYNRLFSILQNLVDNSVKYRCRKHSAVKVQFDEVNDGLVIIVADNGIGIPVTSQKNVFQEGFRVNRDQQGHGLGLYLVKKLIDELGGEIALESSSTGTTFYIKLPNGNTY